MHPVGEHLEKALAHRGWQVVEKEKSESKRENEKWTVRSIWSPVGVGFTLEFLIDWTPGASRGIWGVEAYREGPISSLEKEECLFFALNNGWPGRCLPFVRSLDRWRTRPSQGQAAPPVDPP